MFNDEILDYIRLFGRSFIVHLFGLGSLLYSDGNQIDPLDAASIAGRRHGLHSEYFPNELKIWRLMDFISSSLVVVCSIRLFRFGHHRPWCCSSPIAYLVLLHHKWVRFRISFFFVDYNLSLNFLYRYYTIDMIVSVRPFAAARPKNWKMSDKLSGCSCNHHSLVHENWFFHRSGTPDPEMHRFLERSLQFWWLLPLWKLSCLCGR